MIWNAVLYQIFSTFYDHERKHRLDNGNWLPKLIANLTKHILSCDLRMHGLYQRRERLRLLQNETSVLHSDGRQYLHIRIRFISLFLREIFDHQMYN